MPPGTQLIEPTAGFCVKSTVKKMTSEISKSFFEQKCFVNICFHDAVEKPEQETVTGPNGERGSNWKLPYRVSKLRYDRDNKGTLCSTYDVVFNNEVQKFLVHAEFKKFVADTAVDGIQQVLAEQKEKISMDYKVMQNMNCKGDIPSLMTIKVKTDNPLIDNLDLDNVETRLQKEIEKQKDLHMT